MIRSLFLSCLLAVSCIPSSAFADPSDATNLSDLLLPDNFSVYVRTVVVNHPVNGFDQKTLPTNNDYKATPGCYVACYSHDNKDAVYGVGNNIYVLGQVRVAGKYEGRNCIPQGFENKDIAAESYFNSLCAAKISTCKEGNCWAGGDTGGWF